MSRESAASRSRSMSAADGPVLLLEPLGDQRVLVGQSRLGRAPRKARSALRITATSITSWRSAPHTAGRSPAAATPIAARDRAMPATIALTAIRRVRRAMAPPHPAGRAGRR